MLRALLAAAAGCLFAHACAAQPALTPAELRLADEAGVAPGIATLLREHGTDLRRLWGTDTLTRDSVPRPGLTVAVSEARALPAVRALRERVGPGYAVFRSAWNFGHGDDRIAVLRANDPFAPLAVAGTSGVNHDITTDQVVARLREWDARFGLRIVGASSDWVEAEFVRQPDDMLAFAREVYAFCPDVVDQGTGDVEALAEEMRRFNTVYLWWD